MAKLDFDIREALNAGYTASDIAKDLSETSGYDYEAALKSGYSDDEIISELTGAKMPTAFESVRTGVARGLTEALPSVGAFVGGAKLGFKVPGPVPLKGISAGVTGLSAALAAGTQTPRISEYFFPQEDVVPGAYPFEEAGKTIGYGASFLPAPLAIGSKAPQFLQRIKETTMQYPVRTLFAELSQIIGSGVGAGVAESIAPGELGPRITGEIGGAFLNPVTIFATASIPIQGLVKNIRARVSEGGREAQAANTLLKILQDSGEDVDALIAALNEPSVLQGIKLTPAQKTGNVTLSRIENELANKSVKFATDLEGINKENLAAINNLVELLIQTGDQEALQAASQIRSTNFKNILQARLGLAKKEAQEKSQKIFFNKKPSRFELGEIEKDLVKQALKEAREQEDIFWKQVDKNIQIEPDNIFSSFTKLADEASPESPLPWQIRSFVKRKTNERLRIEELEDLIEQHKVTPIKDFKPQDASKEIERLRTNVGELIKFRTVMLDQARAKADTDPSKARYFGQMADAVLNDLDKLADFDDAYDVARSFSKSLNDTFTRTFARKVTGKTKTGAEKIIPELMIRETYKSAGDITFTRMNQIEDAVTFLSRIDETTGQLVETAGENTIKSLDETGLGTLREAEQLAVQLMARKALDQDGNINPNKLKAFVNEYDEVLTKLGMKSDFEDATKAQIRLNHFKNREKRVLNLPEKTAFGKLNKEVNENPVKALNSILTSKTPFRDLDNIINQAKKSGPEAVDGLKSAIFEWATLKSGPADNISFQKFYKTLFDKFGAKGDPRSLMSKLKTKGVFTVDEVRNLEKMVNEMAVMEKSILEKGVIEGIDTPMNALQDLMARIIGARLGASFSEGNASLIAASAGSRFVRNALDKVPQSMMRDFLFEAMKDPALVADLLKKGKTIGEKVKLAKRINAWFLGSGLGFTQEMLQSDEDLLETFYGEEAKAEEQQPTPKVQTTMAPRQPVSMPTIEPSPFQNIDIFQPQGQPMGGMAGQVLREEEMRKLI